MKTSFWGLLVLVYLISHLHRNEADALSSTAFYIIGHMANDITQVEKHLAEGANALEIDVEFSQGARPVQTRHGFPCCFRDCFSSEIFSYMLKYLRDLSTPEHPNYVQQLALIKLNLKVRSFSNEVLYTAGERLAEAMMVYLFDGGFSGSNAWVLLSVPSPQQIVLFRGLRDAFRRYQMSGLLDKIGYTVGDNMDLLSIERSLDNFGIIDHIWIGDGSSSCLGSRSRDRIERLIDERDTGEAHFDRVFHWTIDEPVSMRSSIRTGVDAIVTNRPDRLLQILSEDEFFGRFRLATADDRPWDKIIEDPFEPIVLPTPPPPDDSAASSSIVLADEPAISIDDITLTDGGLQETQKDASKSTDCKPSSDSDISLDDFSDLGKDADTEKPETATTTAKPEDDVFADLIKELGNSSELLAEPKLSLNSRSTDNILFHDLQGLIGKLTEDKEAKLTTTLIELIWKLSAKPETPSISPTVLHSLLLNMQITTPNPTLNLAQLLQRRSDPIDPSSELLRLLQPTQPTVSPELLKVILNLYAPTTPAPAIPLPLVQALFGIQQQPAMPNVYSDLINFLIGSNSGLSLPSVSSLLKPTSESSVNAEIVRLLVKAITDKTSANTKEESVKELPVVTTVSSVLRRTTERKEERVPKGKGGRDAEKDASGLSEDGPLDDIDLETTTKKAKVNSGDLKNSTRNFPEPGGPPLPAMPGTKVEATFMPHGVNWKVVGSPLRSANPFPFAGNPFPGIPQFQGDGPPFFNNAPFVPPNIHHGGHFHPPLNRPFGNRPSYQSKLPPKIIVHKPITLPLRYPMQSVGHQIRLPNNINIHLPMPALPPPPRPYRQRPPPEYKYPSTTPCPEPSDFYKYIGNYKPKPNKPDPEPFPQRPSFFSGNKPPSKPDPPLLFPAVRPPSVPGTHHTPFLNGNKPELPQRPGFPDALLPGIGGPPVFIDDIDNFDDFLRQNNNSHNVPTEFFASSVKGVKETNLSEEFSITNEDLTPDKEEISEEKSKVTTEKPIENESVDDIVNALNLSAVTAKSLNDDPMEELLAAYEKITNNKEAVEEFLRRVNLSSALTTEVPSLRVDNNGFQTSTSLPEKSSLTQIFNLPPTAGLGWNGQSLDQDKLEQIINKQKQERQPIDVVVIENSPLIVVPHETATWSSGNVQKRETTPPPDDDYDEFFDTSTPISKKPESKPSVTISKPSEGLTKSGVRDELLPGEVEISIPAELFIQRPNGSVETLSKLVKELGSAGKQSHTQQLTKGNGNSSALEQAEEQTVENLMIKDRNDKIIQQTKANNDPKLLERPNFFTTLSPSAQKKYGGVSLRYPDVPYTIINSVNPTTPYPKRVLQRLRTTSKRPHVRIHYRGSGETIGNLDPTTAYPLLYHTMKSQVRKMQEQTEQKYSQQSQQIVINSQNRRIPSTNNNATKLE